MEELRLSPGVRDGREQEDEYSAGHKVLTFRLPSVSDDEPLCLGNLLRIDPGHVVRPGSKTERIKLMWRSIPKQFAPTIFWSSPKIEDEGFRWASVSLMAEGCGRAKVCLEDARWDTGRGLIVTLPAILIRNSSLPFPCSFRLILNGRIRLIVQWDLQPQSKDLPERMHQIRTSQTPTSPTNFVILLAKLLPMEVEDGTDVAFFAKVCDVLKIDLDQMHVRISGQRANLQA